MLTQQEYTPVTKAALPAAPELDERIRWIRQKVENSLLLEFQNAEKPTTIVSGLPPLDFDPPRPKLFAECLERNGQENLQLMVDFLEDMPHSTSALLCWVETKLHKVVIEVPKVETDLKLDSSPPLVQQPQVDDNRKPFSGSLGASGMPFSLASIPIDAIPLTSPELRIEGPPGSCTVN